MTLPMQIPRPGTPATSDGSAAMSRSWQLWLKELILELHKTATPPGAIIPCNLSADDISGNFTGGVGNAGTAYEWWAICNGSNGTPDLSGLFVRHSSTAAGGTGGSLTTAADSTSVAVSAGAGENVSESGHTHTFEPPYYELVYLMRRA